MKTNKIKHGYPKQIWMTQGKDFRDTPNNSSYEINLLEAISSAISSGELDLDIGTGWAIYGDNQYTDGTPLVITAGNTAIVDLNGANSIKTQLPKGVTDFYDVTSSKITPENVGDGYTFTLGFQGTSSSNNGSATFGIDIGGTFGEIFKRNFRFPRGTGITHNFYFTSQGYSLNTFLANGGIIKITSDTGTSNLFNFVLQIHRTHKAKA